MNWVAIPRYRHQSLVLVRLSCGHHGWAESTRPGWFICFYCRESVKPRSMKELPVTWRPA